MANSSLIRFLFPSNNKIEPTHSLFVDRHHLHQKHLHEKHELVNEQDEKDLQSFFYFLLNSNNDRRNSTRLINRNDTRSPDPDYGFYYYMPAALVQLFILVLVFLFVLFMCKCNKMMRTCRDLTQSKSKSTEDKIYNDNVTLADYLCYSCYRYKMRRRFKNRRIRNKRFNRIRMNAKNAADAREKFASRKSSIIRRRTAVVHKNRVYSNSSVKSTPKVPA